MIKEAGVNVNNDTSDDVIHDKDLKLSNYERTIEQFGNYIGDKDFLVLDKSDILHFIKLINYHSRVGFDQYHSSFKIDTSEMKDGFVWLTYNSGLVLARSKVNIKASSEFFPSMLVGVSQFIKAYNSSVECVFMFSVESNMYMYLFGGKFYINTLQLTTDICSKEFLMDKLDAVPVKEWDVDYRFIDTITLLSDMIKTGGKVDERSVYFRDGKAYIFCGNVMGEFEGIEQDLTLQLSDILSLTAFFSDLKEEQNITVEDYERYKTYRCGDKFINLGNRRLKLSDDMRYVDVSMKDYLTINVDTLKNITNFLSASVTDSSISVLQDNEEEVIIKCIQGEGHESKFPVRTKDVSGKGIKGSNIKLSISDVKNFMAPFNGEVLIKVHGNKIYISNDMGGILMFGGV